MTNLKTTAAVAALLSSFALAAPVFAAGEHSEGHAAASYGEPGSKANASRTVEVIMRDNLYEPETISVKAGETVRFVVKNEGELVHEFQIGTPASFEEHAPMMQMMVDHGVLEADKINYDVAKEMEKSMDMSHDEPNSTLLEPGKSGEVVWKFPDDATIEFACTVPGHYESGMVGEFELAH